MIKQLIFSQNDLPSELKWQILSFMRIQWPDGFIGENRLRDWVGNDEFHQTHFVLVEDKNILVGYLVVVWKNLEYKGVSYKTYGLSGVFTYPQFRNQGYGLQLVKVAKEYIEKQDGDIVLFTSEHQGFYEKAGFIMLDGSHLLKGSRSNPTLDPENVFMLFLSDKGKEYQKDFEQSEIYFGEDTW